MHETGVLLDYDVQSFEFTFISLFQNEAFSLVRPYGEIFLWGRNFSSILKNAITSRELWQLMGEF